MFNVLRKVLKGPISPLEVVAHFFSQGTKKQMDGCEPTQPWGLDLKREGIGKRVLKTWRKKRYGVVVSPSGCKGTCFHYWKLLISFQGTKKQMDGCEPTQPWGLDLKREGIGKRVLKTWRKKRYGVVVSPSGCKGTCFHYWKLLISFQGTKKQMDGCEPTQPWGLDLKREGIGKLVLKTWRKKRYGVVVSPSGCKGTCFHYWKLLISFQGTKKQMDGCEPTNT